MCTKREQNVEAGAGAGSEPGQGTPGTAAPCHALAWHGMGPLGLGLCQASARQRHREQDRQRQCSRRALAWGPASIFLARAQLLLVPCDDTQRRAVVSQQGGTTRAAVVANLPRPNKRPRVGHASKFTSFHEFRILQLRPTCHFGSRGLDPRSTHGKTTVARYCMQSRCAAKGRREIWVPRMGRKIRSKMT